MDFQAIVTVTLFEGAVDVKLVDAVFPKSIAIGATDSSSRPVPLPPPISKACWPGCSVVLGRRTLELGHHEGFLLTFNQHNNIVVLCRFPPTNPTACCRREFIHARGTSWSSRVDLLHIVPAFLRDFS